MSSDKQARTLPKDQGFLGQPVRSRVSRDLRRGRPGVVDGQRADIPVPVGARDESAVLTTKTGSITPFGVWSSWGWCGNLLVVVKEGVQEGNVPVSGNTGASR